MAVVTYVGKQIQRAKVVTVTVSSSTVGHTFTLTGGNAKAITYTAVTGDTTSTIASALKALCAASPDGEFAQLTWGEPTSNVFLVTGASDGEPFTLSASGTGTMTATQTTAPLSPHDVSDGANYSTGALPTAGGVDDLVIENTSASLKYNAAALAAIDLISVTRRASHTGTLGLPAINPAGYPEYRTSELELNAPTQRFELNRDDGPGAIRVKNVFTGSAVTVTVLGDGPAPVGQEVVEIRGLPASSVINATGASVAVCPLAGQTATVATLLATDSSLRVGSGVTLTTATLHGCSAIIETGYTTLTLVGGSAVEVGKAAAGSSGGTLVYNGTLTWKSTGSPGNSPVVGPAGVIDFTNAPAAVSVGGTVELNAGFAWLDPAGRCGSYSVKFNRCTPADGTFNPGANKTAAVS